MAIDFIGFLAKMNLDYSKFENAQMMWKPTGEVSENRKRFVKLIEDKYNVKFGDYWDFHKWSVDNLEQFWAEIWNFSGIIYSEKYKKVIDLSVPMNESPRWFEGAKLNFAENLLRYKDDHTGLVTAGEDKETKSATYAEINEHVKLYAAAFRKFGLKKGDIVTCFMSNREEPVYAMLAAVSIGAIWSGALPLIGAEAVLNRFKQINPRILLTVDRFRNNGSEVEMLQKIKTIAEELKSLEKVIIVPSKEESKLKDISGIRNSCFLDEFLQLGFEKDGSVPPIVFEQVSVSHPVFISYTSGTTGLPKAIIHGSGAFLATAKDSCVYGNRTREGTLLSISPVGWASWNIFTTFLFTGVKCILFEGVPYYLSPTYLWDLVDEFKLTELVSTPSVLDELEKRGYFPKEKHSLESLKVVICGSSVVKPNNYDFVYNKIKKEIMFGSAYGSTELMGSGLVFDRSLPIYRGEIACPSIGINLECLDDSGKPVVGEPGELVIKKPTPSLPLGLWGDKDGSLFRKTYFSKYPGKFALGDLAVINPITKGITIFCRSDETLKPKTVRFGSSEIYKYCDSLCVAQYGQNQNERAVLFVKMKAGFPFNEELIKKIQQHVEIELSSGHVPELILETTDIPYNITGKKMEILVKKMINNMPYNTDIVVNQACLKNFQNIPPYED
ncbi:acetoacetyl-CoA synthetase [Trichonephila inaurata madagascariensis]|uniref:Acetoacetyl-CoA synthetase n=1 Tax=Trichonephila inaurata madagascariensis TaxID=2747483 RepID=A0A8X6I724_9ARAC|nr:acetoacetyl-CoA synthetase [Trichonephila inaurata madagascariensis]